MKKPNQANVTPLLAALAAAQPERDMGTLIVRLADALPFADRMVHNGVFNATLLEQAVRDFGEAHLPDYARDAKVYAKCMDAADESDAEDSKALHHALAARFNDQHIAFAIGLAAGLRIGGGR
jgi:hypothetical protein